MEKGQLIITQDISGAPEELLLAPVREAVYNLLDALGADFSDSNFTDTPYRVAKSLIEEFTPIPFDPTSFDNEPYSGMITLPSHQVWTRCPHHLERVRMIVGVSYVPRNQRIFGLSKLARLANSLAVGCILQETYTRILADKMQEILDPEGCGVYTRAYHQCMQARGVKTSSPVIMKELRGIYLHSSQTRQEFLDDCKG